MKNAILFSTIILILVSCEDRNQQAYRMLKAKQFDDDFYMLGEYLDGMGSLEVKAEIEVATKALLYI